MSDMTVLGAGGFVGSHLTTELRRRGHRVLAPDRTVDVCGLDLGTAFYCIGLTADFRSRPFDAVTAHVSYFQRILECCQFTRLVYLSSTRLYLGATSAQEENPLIVNPADPDDLFNLSKALGESLALHSGRPVCIARLSNIYGPDWQSNNFLPTLIKAAIRQRLLCLQTSLRSSKDYISIADVVNLLIHIGIKGSARVYNVASGRNVSNGELTARLRELTGCAIQVIPGAPTKSFPPINIDRISSEFGFSAVSLDQMLPSLLDQYQQRREDWS
jgi:nucleoside-diphosphate-sugar epimerase